MSKRDRSSSFDIAYRAGVSQPTVSRALRNSPLVSAQTRKRIQAIARELNYKVDKNASNLRKQHSGTLALLLFEDPTADASQINPFFLSMLGSITRACSSQGYDLLVSFQQLSDDWHAEYLDTHKADGLILLGYGDYRAYCGKLEKLVAHGTRFVRWGAVQANQPGLAIGCDNFSGGRAITAHLLARGRHRVAFLGAATPGCPEFLERHRGYAAALADRQFTADPNLHVDVVDSTEWAGYRAAQELLSRNHGFDAISAASDLIAIGAMRALLEQGIRVPQDVAVAGFDDIPMAAFAHPPLTTIAQDTRLAGEMLVAHVLRQIHGEPCFSEQLPVRIVVRRSCGASPCLATGAALES